MNCLNCLNCISLHLGSRFQVGLNRALNISKTYEIILPAWKLLFTRQESLLESLYGKTTMEVGVDNMNKNIIHIKYFLVKVLWLID